VGAEVEAETVAEVGDGAAADIAPGTAKTVAVDGREIAVFNVGGAFYAIDNICPHQGASLADGWLEGTTITCPWHAWCFNLTDGTMTRGDFAGGHACKQSPAGRPRWASQPATTELACPQPTPRLVPRGGANSPRT